MKGALVALVMAGASIAATPPASAANVTVSVDPGNIAFGYSDGYWDRGHQWHRWAKPADARAYRSANKEHYVAHRHTAEKDGGYHSEYWNDKH